MDKFNLLDCTLRDGGYITKWRFSENAILEIIRGLIDAGLDFIEVGYINPEVHGKNTTQFESIEKISKYLHPNRKNTIILAMVDVQQCKAENITPYTEKSIDGIRVVFYKHQINEAMNIAKAVKKCGYKLFMQPMVTVDYTLNEYVELSKYIADLEPYGVSIVDSFGYMLKSDFRNYFKILDDILEPYTIIGFHSHNNMNLAFVTAQDVLEYDTRRRIIIDCSLYGIGRGAGNLNTELITNYYNMVLGKNYDISRILELIDEYIMPIRREKEWGYSPYLFITGLYHYHPNFACYLLEEHSVSISEFERFIHTIPNEMSTKCRKSYVLEMWKKFKESTGENII